MYSSVSSVARSAILGAATIVLSCAIGVLALGCVSGGAPVESESRSADRPEPSAPGPLQREILAEDISYDAPTGEIRYTLPEPALVRIRVGIRDGGPMLRTLVDWEERAAGPHTEIWDKRDSSGLVDFGETDGLMFVLICIPPDTKERAASAGGSLGYRRSPELSISLPESADRTEDGFVIVGDRVPIRVTIAPEDKKWLTETKYEVALFIDGVFLMEDEEGISPFTYELDTRALNEGLHTVTVNIIAYEGEIGSRSVNVYVATSMAPVR